MAKKNLNQASVWGLALAASLACFGVGYGIVTLFAKSSSGTSHQSHDGPEDTHHSPAEDAHGDAHGDGSHDSKSAPKADHHGDSSENSHENSKDDPKEKSHSSAPQSKGHDSPKPPDHGGSGSAPHWTYTGSQGPQAWGDLDGGFATCKAGKKQSPVDIDQTHRNSELLPIKFYYKPIETIVKNNGHAVQAELPKQSLYIELEGERYDLIQYHFHVPSEHKVSGQPYDMELHLVHRHSDGTLAVIGILFEEGKALAPLDPVLKSIPEEVGVASATFVTNPMAFLPPQKAFFRYDGSLTTPPCTEGVKWHVIAQPMDASAKQIDTLSHFYRSNARPVQNLLGRKVWRSTRS